MSSIFPVGEMFSPWLPLQVLSVFGFMKLDSDMRGFYWGHLTCLVAFEIPGSVV